MLKRLALTTVFALLFFSPMLWLTTMPVQAQSPINGSIVINNGNITTTSRNVNLALNATSTSGQVITMSLTDDFLTWEQSELSSMAVLSATVLSDIDAFDGKAVKALATNGAGTMIFGPYTYDLPQSKPLYADFRLKVADNTITETVIDLDIVDSDFIGFRLFASLSLKGTDFQAAHQYQTFRLNFTYLNANVSGVEFRVLTRGKTDVIFDNVMVYVPESYYAQSYNWKLGDRQGEHWVGVKFSDSQNNISSLYTDSIKMYCSGYLLCNTNFSSGKEFWNTLRNGNSNDMLDVGRDGTGYAHKSVQQVPVEQYIVWQGPIQEVLVTSGQTYLFEAWLKYENACSLHMKVDWLDENGQFLANQGSNQVMAFANGNSGGWVKKGGTIIAPVGAYMGRTVFFHGVNLQTNQNCPGSTLWVDDVTFETAFTTCTNIEEITPGECNALTALYNDTNGANWTNKTNWLVTNKPCSWYGVTCSDGHVTNLSLNHNNLVGTIPPQLGNLTALQTLGMFYNQLSGSIPNEIGNLSQLKVLSLFDNPLTGNLPTTIGSLSNLEEIHLYTTQIGGELPTSLGNLSKLKLLTLNGNQFTGNIPTELGNLTNLTYLSLDGNQLSGSLPSTLGNLKNLTVLGLSYNKFTGNIPTWLGGLTKLTNLGLWGNQFTGSIPPELGKLSMLQILSLFNNQLTGTLPPELGNLSSLREIHLFGTQLTGYIPPEFGKLTNLEKMTIFNSHFTGTLPTELGNLTKLSQLRIENNMLSGEIPVNIVNLTALSSTQTDLGYNALTTSSPAVKAFLDSKDPDWAQTQTVPPTHVKAVAASSSSAQLTWTPISYTTHGGYYQVYRATTSGGPYTLVGQTSNKSANGYLVTGLEANTTYYFVVNSYTPAHDNQLNNLTSAYSAEAVLYDDFCKAVSQIPLTECQALQTFYNSTGGATNWLTKTHWLVTTTPCDWHGVTCFAGRVSRLELMNNKLVGTLPPQLGNLTQLNTLNLGQNELTGALPAELGNLSMLDVLTVWSNGFSGSIPPSLGQLTFLTHLNLGGNNLSGTVPAELGQLKNLLYLQVATNLGLSGSLPLSLTQLTKLNEFYFYQKTGLCAPMYVPEFKTWWNGIAIKESSTVDCATPTPTPTLTPTATATVTPTVATPTPTATATPTVAPPTPTATATPTVASPTPTVNPPTPTPTGTVTLPDPTPGNPQTMYEPNDSCAEAKGITTDGVMQLHSFGQQADEDWVVFKTQAGVYYQIEAQVAPDSPADLTLELWGTCTGKTQDYPDGNFSAGVRWKYQAVANQLVYLKLKNEPADVYGANVTYYLSVRQLSDTPELGAVIIVAGKYEDGDPLQKNIHNVTNRVYQLFVDQGYNVDGQHIKYLATDKTIKGVDDFATQANLEAAITQWAAEPVRNRSLTLYLFDHGSRDKVYLDGPRNETVSPKQLDAWLTQLETAAPGVKVNVIIEACYSGSFISSNVTSVSKVGRVVIASTTSKTLAFASRRRAGAVFSDYLFDGVGQKETLYSAFQRAHWSTKELHPSQIPWLDDNGNGIPNEQADGQVAMLRGLSVPGTFSPLWAPYIAQVAASSQIVNGTGLLQTVVYDKSRVEAVWALVYPPSYRAPVNQIGLVNENEITLPSIVFDPKDNNRYEANYTKFDEVGVYRVVVLAKNEVNLEAQPKSMLIPVLHGGQLITPTEAITLSYQTGVTVHMPAAVFTATTVLSQTSLTTPSLAMPAGWYFAGQALRLEAYQYGQLVTHTLQFTTPITLTFSYREEDITNLDESTLELRYWNGQAWTTNGITRLSHNPEANVIQFTLSHLSDFALFGQAKAAPKIGVYLPLIVK